MERVEFHRRKMLNQLRLLRNLTGTGSFFVFENMCLSPSLSKMPQRPITRLRKLCLALPEAHEVEAWETPTFGVRKKMFAMYAAAGRHGRGRDAVWIKAAPGDQERMIQTAPDCFFVPPDVGPSGWVGI